MLTVSIFSACGVVVLTLILFLWDFVLGYFAGLKMKAGVEFREHEIITHGFNTISYFNAGAQILRVILAFVSFGAWLFA